ncbi:MAG TPA: 50S ribosomal protein L9 [Candidatus Acidoferrales bacterium]|nr:50S ribosomal protein L9 [Candidatus Acidoferrales bacterium]
MKVILRKNYEGLGEIGKVIDVRDGYARNFLIPQKVAYPFAPGYLKMIENEKKAYEAKLNREVHDAKTLAEKLNGVEISLEVQAGEEDKLFGSVTSQMIVDKLAEKGFEVDRRRVELAEPIKSIGEYKVPLKLHQQVTTEIKVSVKKQAE